jgi:hypothetical protein
MAELLVFTLLAAIAATYPILPEHRQLRVRYNLWTKPRLGFIALMLAVILATYWASVIIQSKEQHTLKISVIDWSTTITLLHVESIQLGAVIGIVGLFAMLFLKSNVWIRNEDNLLEILRDLYTREAYTVLVNLLQDNYRPLVNHPSSPVHPESLTVAYLLSLEDDAPEEGWEGQVQQKKRLLRYYGAKFRYWVNNTAEEASDYTETLLLDPEFVGLYSGLASELGLEIISDDSLEDFPQQEVAHRYLRTQLTTENSLLYRNLEHNTESDSLYGYRINDENRLVHALFSDFERAEDLNVYKPIGDKTRELIREQRREEFDKYNDQQLTDTRIQDDFIFRDPIFVGIQFFDLMVKEAFHQEVEWHVWLSYYESFTREICRNYEITQYSDPDAEWPNDYSRLLYEMNSNMLDWIKMMEEELKPNVKSSPNGTSSITEISPEGEESETESSSEGKADSDDGSSDKEEQAGTDDESTEEEEQESAEVGDHVQLGRISTNRGQRNIPEMTVIILFSCHEEVLTSNEVPVQFMSYLTESIFLCMLDLRNYEKGSLQWRYSELMLHCLEENITGRRADPSYQEHLKRVYHDHHGGPSDYGVRHEVTVKDTQMTGLVDNLDDLIDS